MQNISFTQTGLCFEAAIVIDGQSFVFLIDNVADAAEAKTKLQKELNDIVTALAATP